MEVGNPAGSPTQTQSGQMDMGILPTIVYATGLTGGGSNLDGTTTVGRKLPSILIVISDTPGVTGVWKLLTSSASTGPGCVQPVDNSAVRLIKYI